MSNANKYDNSFIDNAVKLARSKGCLAASNEIKVPYEILQGWVLTAFTEEVRHKSIDSLYVGDITRLNKEISTLIRLIKHLDRNNRHFVI